MLHATLIAVHALAGIVGFVLGCLILRPLSHREGTVIVFRAYQAAILLMLTFLVLVVAVDWTELSGVTQGVYVALSLLGGYTAWRAWHAGIARATQSSNWQATYIEDIGFTLITLFVGFVIIAAIDLGAPAWAVGLVAVLGVATGRWAIGRVKHSS